MPIPVHPGLKTGVLENTVIEVDRQPSPTKRDKLGDVQKLRLHKGGRGGQLGGTTGLACNEEPAAPVTLHTVPSSETCVLKVWIGFLWGISSSSSSESSCKYK